MTRRYALISIVLTAVIGMASGCSSVVERQGATGPDPQNSVITVSGYPVENTPEMAVAAADMVFEGAVVRIGSASWNTADRKPRESRSQDEVPPIIYTPYIVRVAASYKGNAEGDVMVKSFGGTVDNQTMRWEGAFLPSVGDRLIVCANKGRQEANGDRMMLPKAVYKVSGDDARGSLGATGTVGVVQLRALAK